MNDSMQSRRTSVFLRNIRDFISHIFNLEEGKAADEEVIEDIKRGVTFRGTNLWILICAIFIASIGLNMNSTAVVIGAMLISPLMGPIMGLGLGIGIFDIQLIRRALMNLAVAAIISVLTSTIYFLITPLDDAQTEILARTTPTLWDVLIALFGGFAGIIASSRQDKSNAIPGVAIATALMPPLCTAGYGIATGQWSFFMGAFYLFSINCVFITVSTVVIVKYLRYRPKQYVDAKTESRVRIWISLLVIATMIPSIFIAYNVVQKSFFERKARTFLEEELNQQTTQVISQQLIYRPDTSQIVITCIGQTIDSAQILKMTGRMPHYGLSNTQLIVRQDYNQVNSDVLAKFNTDLRTGILEDLYTKNAELMQNKDARITMLEKEIVRYRTMNTQSGDISKEIKVQYPTLTEFSLSRSPIHNLETAKIDTAYVAYAKFKKRPTWRETKRMEDWLKVRTKSKTLRLITE
jgi:uncharacterized hydrophobic protein (TIGR00271 family)